ncbi:NAD-dependent epimerase/dehydratase family protein [Glaciibacter psychrotolerans]|uniref:UDP-glucose 4-epimerase n=1 Tax=Glaciibacter psychrotolerans TaxID=670054 RepID=A0A7Z0J574_9MICO|nr:NAD-dependent epimerase/dehydratase family protein [Leifsonia psychrotolerans]NYJ19100.1 dTDP-L-rhamnose 4-epimerase [Leifsonia psychrotolerans]
MTRLLVTGGAGFIGSHIVQAAVARGWSVRVLDSLRPDVHGSRPVLPDAVDLHVGEVADRSALDAALDGIDVVCHQAAKVGLGVDLQDAPDYARSNVLATAELVAGLVRHDVSRVLCASSMVVYGEGMYRGRHGDVRPPSRRSSDLGAGRFDPQDPETGEALDPALLGEDAALDPRNVYAVTKLAEELLLASWAREVGGTLANLRYHNVYGPGMPRNTPYAGVASLFRSAIERGEAPRVFEDGAQRRDFVHVHDVATANIAAVGWSAAQQPGTVRAFNIGSGEVTTILQMATALATNAGAPAPVVTGEFRAGDVRHITASSDRARRELDWQPVVGFAQGMREFATARLRD